jgi:hypothetical protein
MVRCGRAGLCCVQLRTAAACATVGVWHSMSSKFWRVSSTAGWPSQSKAAMLGRAAAMRPSAAPSASCGRPERCHPRLRWRLQKVRNLHADPLQRSSDAQFSACRTNCRFLSQLQQGRQTLRPSQRSSGELRNSSLHANVKSAPSIPPKRRPACRRSPAAAPSAPLRGPAPTPCCRQPQQEPCASVLQQDTVM